MFSDNELHRKGIELRDRLFGGDLGEKMNEEFRAISPDLEAVCTDWVMGGIMTRPGIDLLKRELVIIAYSVAAEMPGGVKAHALAALRLGATREEIYEVVFQAVFYTCLGKVKPCLFALKELFDDLDKQAAEKE